MKEKRTVTKDQVRAAKAVAIKSFATDSNVVGIGISKRDDRYCLKVNLKSSAKQSIPKQIAGVPVVTEVTGAPQKISL